MVKITTLDSGLCVATETRKASRSTAVGAWLGVGSRHENDDEQGLAHFVEHAVFKGTKKYADSFKIANAIEKVGGDLNAETEKEHTGYYAQVPSEHWSDSLSVLLEMTKAPLLKRADVASEGRVILEEIATYKDNPSLHVLDMLAEVVWPDQPLGRNELGLPSIIRKTGPAELWDFIERHYRPRNMVITHVGPACHEEVVDWLSGNFRMRPGRDRTVCTPVVERESGPGISVLDRDIEEAHLCLGIKTVARGHPDHFVVALLSTMLGSGMSSRLFQEVRDKRGLAYDVSTRVMPFLDTGVLMIYAGAHRKKAVEAVKATVAQLADLRHRQVSEEELADAKRKYLGLLAIRLEGALARGEWLGRNVLRFGREISFREVENAVNAVQAGQLQAVASRCFTEGRLNLAAIGRGLARQKLLDALEL
jgi:predicted Zn-dependent peptidase